MQDFGDTTVPATQLLVTCLRLPLTVGVSVERSFGLQVTYFDDFERGNNDAYTVFFFS